MYSVAFLTNYIWASLAAGLDCALARQVAPTLPLATGVAWAMVSAAIQVAQPVQSLQSTWTKRNMQLMNFIPHILSGHANMSTFAAQAGDTDSLYFHAVVALTQLIKLG